MDESECRSNAALVMRLLPIIILFALVACSPKLGGTVNPVDFEILEPENTPLPVTLPDLIISRMYLEMEGRQGGCVDRYTPYGIRVVIQNAGKVDASAFVVEVIGSQKIVVEGLVAGEERELHFAGTLPGGQYRAAIDTANQVAESDEGNNDKSYLAPTPTPPPICVSTPRASP